MPSARSPADILSHCSRSRADASGRGFMVKTVADRLGISFERAEAMAVAAAVAGLVRHEVHTLTLTGEGRSAECPVPQLEEGVGLHGRDRDVGLRATVI